MDKRLVFTVEEFCESHRISRGLFYLLLKRGEGPVVTYVGRKPTITAENAATWRGRLPTARPQSTNEKAAAMRRIQA